MFVAATDLNAVDDGDESSDSDSDDDTSGKRRYLKNTGIESHRKGKITDFAEQVRVNHRKTEKQVRVKG